MSRFNKRTVDISTDILILPGFEEGLSQRGAWFACTAGSEDFLKLLKGSERFMHRYVVYEPDSPSPLSDGELFHLANRFSFSFEEYKSNLHRMEMQFSNIRKQGKLNAFIYLLGILTVRWYWWIFLTRGEMSFYNHRNAVNLKKAVRTDRIEARLWTRGSDPLWKEVLNNTWHQYRSLEGDGLEKYKKLIEWAEKQKERDRRYGKVADSYRDILARLTGRSLYTTILPTTFFQRLLFFFNRSLPLPLPDNIRPVRNLSIPLAGEPAARELPASENRVDGNIIELFLLASKKGDPVCVADSKSLDLAGTLARTSAMRRRDRELKVVLHVGTEKERRSLLEGKNRTALQGRILNAALDTIHQSEIMLCYQMREILPVYARQIKVLYPFRSRLHGLFPWLFITNGIPVASILALVWLFVDPYYTGKFSLSWSNYYSRALETLDLSYHDLTVEVKCHSGLGAVNRIIRENERNRGFGDSLSELNRFALPVSLMDRVLLNNLTMETNQLPMAAREANSFTTIPATLLEEVMEDG